MRELFELWAGSVRQVPRRLRAFLLEFRTSPGQNWGMGIMALAFSTVLWVVVTIEQNPPKTAMLPNPIPVQPVNVPADMDILGDIGTVSLTVTAPLDLWERLSPSNFEAIVDLASAMGEGEVEVPVRARAKDNRTRIVGVAPAKVKVNLGALKSQLVPVKVNLQEAPPFGYTFDTPVVSLEQVTVLGPDSLVSLVDAAVADVNLISARETVAQSVRLTPRTARGYEISGVTLEPAWVVVVVAIQQRISYQTLPILPQTQGQVAPGFWVRSVVAVPANVTVVGPRDVLEGVGYLKTEAIDISVARGNLSRAVGLVLPPAVRLVDPSVTRVDIQIEPIEGTAVLYIAPEFRGLAPLLEARASVPTLEVWVSGAGPTLQQLSPNQLAVLVDVGGLGVGTYRLMPTVRVPTGIQFVRLVPEQLEVTIK